MKHGGFKRFLRHMFSAPWVVRKHFPMNALGNIEQAIAASEQTHAAQIRFVVEADLDIVHVLRGKTPRQRAIELFSQLGIWDTEQNNGVLIYLLLADRDVEIVADRGIHQLVGNATWEHICQQMEMRFSQGAFESGVLIGIQQISALLAQHFPPRPQQPNELSNATVLI